MNRKMRILIADDHALVREGIGAFLKMSDEVEVVGEAADGVAAIEAVRKHRPDIILLDISMPRLGGLEAMGEIRNISPDTKVLVLTQYEDPVYVRRFFKAGAAGYLLKKAVGTDLLEALKALAEGKVYVHPSVASSLVSGYVGAQKGEHAEDPYDTLTDRERQVLKLIAEGHTHKEMADILGISVKTAVAHQSNLCVKLDLHTRAALIKFSIQKGIIKIDG